MSVALRSDGDGGAGCESSGRQAEPAGTITNEAIDKDDLKSTDLDGQPPDSYMARKARERRQAIQNVANGLGVVVQTNDNS